MGWVQLRLLQRRYGDALQLLRSAAAAGPQDSGFMIKEGDATLEAFLLHKLGDDAAAAELIKKARVEVEAKVREMGDQAMVQADYAQVLAVLGEKEAAIAAVERARQLLPESVDALERPDGHRDGGASVRVTEGE